MTPTPHGRQFAQHPHARAIAHIDHPRLPQRMHSPRIPPVQHQGQGRPPSFRCRVAITAYQNEGHTVEDQHLAHISPARFEHINPYSTYNLNVEAVLQRIRHRPLKPAQPIRRSTTRRFGTNDQPPPRRQHLRTPNPEPRTPRYGRVLRCRRTAMDPVPQRIGAVAAPVCRRLRSSRGVSGGHTPTPGPRTLTNTTQKPRSRFAGRENPATPSGSWPFRFEPFPF